MSPGRPAAKESAELETWKRTKSLKSDLYRRRHGAAEFKFKRTNSPVARTAMAICRRLQDRVIARSATVPVSSTGIYGID